METWNLESSIETYNTVMALFSSCNAWNNIVIPLSTNKAFDNISSTFNPTPTLDEVNEYMGKLILEHVMPYFSRGTLN